MCACRFFLEGYLIKVFNALLYFFLYFCLILWFALIVYKVAAVREKPGKNRIFLKGIEKSGNSVSSQGNTKFYLKSVKRQRILF